MSGHERRDDRLQFRVAKRPVMRIGNKLDPLPGAQSIRETATQPADPVQSRKHDKRDHAPRVPYSLLSHSRIPASPESSRLSIFATSALSSGLTLLAKSATTLPLRSIRYL